jgi:hypothetical protein
MVAWVNAGDADSVPQDVFALIYGAGLIECPGIDPAADAPYNPAQLMTRLREVGEEQAVSILARLMSKTLAYHAAGRYDRGKAQETARALTRLLGHGARWWTNTDGDLTGRHPVTRHVFDGVVVAAGNGIVVTVLAFDED